MHIRDLPDSGIITESGAYRIPLELYHRQDICAGPSVSSSGLRTLYNESPAMFWAYSDLNPERFERPESDAFAIGRAAHALMLGDEVFDERFIVLDPDAPPRPTATQIRAAAEGRISDSYSERSRFWRDFDEDAEGKTVVKAAWIEDITHMAKALAKHPLVRPLFEGESEVSLIWKDKATGIWVKSRPDVIPAMGEVHADLKIVADVTLEGVTRSIRKFGYDMQMGLAAVAEEIVIGRKVTSAILVNVQKTPPYSVTPIEITEDALHWGKLKCRRALDVFAHCLKAGDWPGPVEGIPQYHTPPWELALIEEQQKAGAFPHSWE